jgi:hypothetical protein
MIHSVWFAGGTRKEQTNASRLHSLTFRTQPCNLMYDVTCHITINQPAVSKLRQLICLLPAEALYSLGTATSVIGNSSVTEIHLFGMELKTGITVICSDGWLSIQGQSADKPWTSSTRFQDLTEKAFWDITPCGPQWKLTFHMNMLPPSSGWDRNKNKERAEIFMLPASCWFPASLTLRFWR